MMPIPTRRKDDGPAKIARLFQREEESLAQGEIAEPTARNSTPLLRLGP